MRISVITPTLLRPKALAFSERVWSQQTRPPDEHVIVEEAWSSIYHNYTPVNPFANYLICATGIKKGVHRRLSIGQKLNRGVNASSGDLIVIAGDDNYYAPDYLELVEAKFASDPGLLYLTRANMTFYNIRHGYAFTRTSTSCGAGFVLRADPMKDEFAFPHNNGGGEDTAYFNLFRESVHRKQRATWDDPHKLIPARHDEVHHRVWVQIGCPKIDVNIDKLIPDAETRRLFMECV